MCRCFAAFSVRARSFRFGREPEKVYHNSGPDKRDNQVGQDFHAFILSLISGNSKDIGAKS
jgi:hypothetical protein